MEVEDLVIWLVREYLRLADKDELIERSTFKENSQIEIIVKGDTEAQTLIGLEAVHYLRGLIRGAQFKD